MNSELTKKIANLSIKHFFVAIITVVMIIAGFYLYSNNQTTLAARQNMIHEGGSHVMPFDLSKTTHVFKKTENGGIQQVIAKDKKDTDQISMIQMHLQMEAQAFQEGDFSDPTKLHGEDMPGVKELSSNSSKIKIEYSTLPYGAQITYTSSEEEVINAIHAWFDAQLLDHGDDAIETL